MKRLLITGCGDVAMRAIPLLMRRYRIYALVRNPDRREKLRALGVLPVPGDLDDRASLRRIAGLPNAVLHFAPPANSGTCDMRTHNLLSVLSLKALPERLVYISTSGVYGDCGGAWVSETRAATPSTARAGRRVDAERQLRRWGKRGGPVVSILRAPGIYAAERLPVERIRRGDPVLRGEDDVFTNHIHADDLACCSVAALRHGRPNRVYHASDDSARPGLKMAEWFDAVAAAFALPRPRRVSRAEAETQLAPLTLSFMSESRRLDNRRIKEELRVRLRYPNVAAGLSAITSSDRNF